MNYLTSDFSKKSVTLQIPIISRFGIKGILNEDNSVKTELVVMPNDVKPGFLFALNKATIEYQNRPVYIMTVYLVIFIMALIAGSFLSMRILSVALAWCISDALYNFEAAKYVIMMVESYCRPEIKEIKGIHAATHMVFNAYENLHRVPTIEEVKKASKYRSWCSCAIRGKGICIVTFACFAIMFFPPFSNSCLVSKLFTIILYVIIVIVIAIISIVLSDYIYKYISFFSLRQPTDAEINLVIEIVRQLDIAKLNPVQYVKEKYSSSKLDDIFANYIIVTFSKE